MAGVMWGSGRKLKHLLKKESSIQPNISGANLATGAKVFESVKVSSSFAT